MCQDDVYLKQLICYIPLNFARAGFVDGLEKLDTYSYSGHKVLMRNATCHWLQANEILSLFGKTEILSAFGQQESWEYRCRDWLELLK